jgi:hypothetical protein
VGARTYSRVLCKEQHLDSVGMTTLLR